MGEFGIIDLVCGLIIGLANGFVLGRYCFPRCNNVKGSHGKTAQGTLRSKNH